MFAPGDIVRFYSEIAGKRKYHLCLSLHGHFLFINSPKGRIFRGDFVVPCTAIPCIPPTESGKSIISCSSLVKMTDHELKHVHAEKMASIDISILKDLLIFVEASPVLSPDEKDAIINELGECI